MSTQEKIAHNIATAAANKVYNKAYRDARNSGEEDYNANQIALKEKEAEYDRVYNEQF